LRINLWLVLAFFAWPLSASAQLYTGTGNIHEVFVGTESESYFRYLDLTDTTSNASLLIRPLSPSQLKTLARAVGGTPWQARLTGFADSTTLYEFGLLSPSASVRYNSQFPYGSNDGAIWAGRGATIAAQAGVYARAGPLSVTLLPTVFRAECRVPVAFALPRGWPPDLVALSTCLNGSAVNRINNSTRARAVRIDIRAGRQLTTANEGWDRWLNIHSFSATMQPAFRTLSLAPRARFQFLLAAQLKVIYGRLTNQIFAGYARSFTLTSGNGSRALRQRD
jgi:hypothetical protein